MHPRDPKTMLLAVGAVTELHARFGQLPYIRTHTKYTSKAKKRYTYAFWSIYRYTLNIALGEIKSLLALPLIGQPPIVPIVGWTIPDRPLFVSLKLGFHLFLASIVPVNGSIDPFMAKLIWTTTYGHTGRWPKLSIKQTWSFRERFVGEVEY